ncbi:unnamed protein product [Phytomonas sp. Hart1]|nr:unnamed protein product [Phytomonas sp. Hart1]|eukprot:CCW68709.1 unnamed protein product [Phytomonas sp. isolate Hart1]
MSSNVKFLINESISGTGRSTNTGNHSKPERAIILPYDILYNLQGRRVTILLSVRGEELEGILRTVDNDRGDLMLEDVVHYEWLAALPEGHDGTSTEHDHTGPKGPFRTCLFGGVRREVRRCATAMVNSKFIHLITPTLFGEEKSSS